MPQHKKLSILPLRLPPIPHDLPPSMRQYLEQHHAALEAYAKSMASIDICSGLTKFSDAVNKGYFLGFTRNGTGYDDGTPVFIVGDRSAEKYFEFDGEDLRLGASTQFQGADAYNNETTYYHTFFESLENVVTAGTPAFDSSSGVLEISSGDTAYRVSEQTIGTFSFESGTVRMKVACVGEVSGWGNGTYVYFMTGSRIGTNSGFGFVAKADGSGGADWYGVSNQGGVETLTAAVGGVGVSGVVLEAVLTAGEKIEFYVNGVKQAEITSGLPEDGAGKGIQSQRCLYYMEGSANALTVGFGEYRLLHERN